MSKRIQPSNHQALLVQFVDTIKSLVVAKRGESGD